MLHFNHKITGFLLAIVSVFAVESCIDEEYSLKDADTSFRFFPGLSFGKDVHYVVPISSLLDVYLDEGGHIHTDSKGNYVLYAYSTMYYGETAVCNIEQSDIPYEGGPMVLHGASLTYCLNESLLSRVLDLGTSLHTPVKIKLENHSNIEGDLSIIVQNYSESMSFDGFKLKPGINEITLDSEDFMNFVMRNWRQSGVIDFILTPEGGELPEPVCTISTSAYLPIEIMPGQQISFTHFANIESGDVHLEDIPSGITNGSCVLTMKASVENTIPADINFEIINGPEYYQSGNVIEGLTPIPAGSLDAPKLTEMNWKVVAEDGLSKSFFFFVTATIGGDKPIPFSSRYGIKYNLTSIIFESGI